MLGAGRVTPGRMLGQWTDRIPLARHPALSASPEMTPPSQNSALPSACREPGPEATSSFYEEGKSTDGGFQGLRDSCKTPDREPGYSERGP